MKSFIVKERYRGKWINTYFDFEVQARILCEKIIAAGGRAVWMRNSY